MLFGLLVALPLLFIAAFSVGPELWERHRRTRREKLALAVDDAALDAAGYFRLDPSVQQSLRGGYGRDVAAGRSAGCHG